MAAGTAAGFDAGLAAAAFTAVFAAGFAAAFAGAPFAAGTLVEETLVGAGFADGALGVDDFTADFTVDLAVGLGVAFVRADDDEPALAAEGAGFVDAVERLAVAETFVGRVLTGCTPVLETRCGG